MSNVRSYAKRAGDLVPDELTDAAASRVDAAQNTVHKAPAGHGVVRACGAAHLNAWGLLDGLVQRAVPCPCQAFGADKDVVFLLRAALAWLTCGRVEKERQAALVPVRR